MYIHQTQGKANLDVCVDDFLKFYANPKKIFQYFGTSSAYQSHSKYIKQV